MYLCCMRGPQQALLLIDEHILDTKSMMLAGLPITNPETCKWCVCALTCTCFVCQSQQACTLIDEHILETGNILLQGLPITSPTAWVLC